MFRSCVLAAAVVLVGWASASAGEDEPAAPKRILAGTVVDADDRPVAGADVWLTGTGPTGEAVISGHAESDAAGRFEIEVPPEWFAVSTHASGSRSVFAWKTGMRLAVQRTTRLIPPPEAVRLVLEPATSESLVVRGPQGEPIEGARLRVMSVGREAPPTLVPEELGLRLACRTDARGAGDVTILPLEAIGRLAVDSDRFGEQHKLAPPEGGWSEGIALRPAGRLVGRVTADDAKLAAGLRIDVFTEVGGSISLGRARVTTGADGRFDVPAIMQGRLMTLVRVPAGVPWAARGSQSKHELIKDAVDWAVEGELTEVEIPLERAVRAQGVVRERGSGRPIAGVAVRIGSDAVVSDAEGHYAFHVLPPRAPMVVAVPLAASVPLEYLPPAPDEMPSVEIAAGARHIDVPPIELTPAVLVRGRVLDERGERVAGARVEARVMTPDLQHWGDVLVLADGSGEFVIEGVDPQARVLLKARHGDAVTERPLLRPASAREPIILTVSPDHRIALRGRAVDPAGQPVAAANVVIWRRTFPFPRKVHEEALRFEEELSTDADGHFATPRTLEPEGIYSAVISGPGLRSTRTRWLAVGAPGDRMAQEQKATFADVIVARLQPLSGEVVDRQGTPVPQASVTLLDDRERQQTTTGADGRFRFESVPTGKAFLLVEKPGFRFAGRLVDAAEGSAPVRLVRIDEQPEHALRTLPQELPRERRFALARRLIEPLLAEGAQTDPGMAHRAFEVLAAIDPEGTLERVNEQPPADPNLNAFVRMAIAQRLLQTDPEDALLVAESVEHPMARIKVYLDACDALPDARRQRKLELLSEALVHARGTENPPLRAVALGLVGERLLDLGETDQATGILREGHAIARELPTDGFGGYARGAFAEELAQIDLDAALELTAGLQDNFEYNRHHGNIAHELGAKDPAEAERVLGMLRTEDAAGYIILPRDQYAVRVCYRMAPVDLERAVRIADAAGTAHQRAYIYGTMALALAETDKPAATDLLRRAFAILQETVEAGEDRFNYVYSASTIAARLLPAAEQIDPRLVPEFVWRTVSFRIDPPDDEQEARTVDQSNAILAVLLARYDRDVARSLLAPLGASRDSRSPWLRAMALLHPERAVEDVEQLDDSDENVRRTNLFARLRVAMTLALDGEELWNAAAGDTGLWVPDKEDL